MKYRKPLAPQVNDKDIQTLIRKYPLKSKMPEPENEEVNDGSSSQEEQPDLSILQNFRQKNANIARICQNVEQ